MRGSHHGFQALRQRAVEADVERAIAIGQRPLDRPYRQQALAAAGVPANAQPPGIHLQALAETGESFGEALEHAFLCRQRLVDARHQFQVLAQELPDPFGLAVVTVDARAQHGRDSCGEIVIAAGVDDAFRVQAHRVHVLHPVVRQVQQIAQLQPGFVPVAALVFLEHVVQRAMQLPRDVLLAVTVDLDQSLAGLLEIPRLLLDQQHRAAAVDDEEVDLAAPERATVGVGPVDAMEDRVVVRQRLGERAQRLELGGASGAERRMAGI